MFWFWYLNLVCYEVIGAYLEIESWLYASGLGILIWFDMLDLSINWDWDMVLNMVLNEYDVLIDFGLICGHLTFVIILSMEYMFGTVMSLSWVYIWVIWLMDLYMSEVSNVLELGTLWLSMYILIIAWWLMWVRLTPCYVPPPDLMIWLLGYGSDTRCTA